MCLCPLTLKGTTTGGDAERYQTIYAQVGGLGSSTHGRPAFYRQLFLRNWRLKTYGHHEFVTLHVGAGTFKPVKASTMQGHLMHAEWIDVSAVTISNLIHQLSRTASLLLAPLPCAHWKAFTGWG